MSGDANSALFSELAQFISSPASRPTGEGDIAKLILSNSTPNYNYTHPYGTYHPPVTPPVIPKTGGGKSSGFFGSLIDILSRPMYAVGSAINNSSNPKDSTLKQLEGFGSGLVSGIEGKTKIDPYQAMLNHPEGQPTFAQNLPKTGVGRAIMGTAVDIAGDPTTYVGGPIAKGLFKGLGAATGASKGAKGLQAAASFSPLDAIAASKATPPVSSLGAIQAAGHAIKPAESIIDDIKNQVPGAVESILPKGAIALPKLSPGLEATSQNLAASLAKTSPKAFNPSLQVQLFNKIQKEVGKLGDINRSPAVVHSMFQHAMDHLDILGKSPEMWDGSKGSISDLWTQMGDKFQPSMLKELQRPTGIIHPDLKEGIEHLRAHSAMDAAPSVSVALNEATKTAAAAETSGLADSAVAHVMQDFRKEATNVVKAVGAGSAAERTVGSTIGDILKNAENPAQRAIRSTIGRVVETGDRNIVRTATDKALRTESVPIESFLHKGARTLNENDAIHSMVARFATWVGQKDLRPSALDTIGSAKASAELRGHLISQAFKGIPKDDAKLAFQAAAGHYPNELLNPAASKLADQIANSMQQFFKSSLLGDKIQQGMTLTDRSQMLMSDLNKQLQKNGFDFRFTNDSHVPIYGQVEKFGDYSKPGDWSKSWESAAPTDPARFMFVVQSAGEKVARDISLLDDLASKFGSTVARGDVKYTVDNPYLKGVYFDKNIAGQVHTMLKNYENLYNPGNGFLRLLNSVQGQWKSGVTIYRPGFHIRNFVGDTWLNWMAGVNSATPYLKAGRVLSTQKGRYSLDNAEALLNPKNLAEPSKTVPIIKTKNGVGLTAVQVYQEAFNRGMFQSAKTLQDVSAETPHLIAKFSPFQGKVKAAASATSEYQEHAVRLAQFLDIISKTSTRGTTMRQVLDDAAHMVRKTHPDGQDLTKQEKAVRTLIPFYSWMRKSTPLIIEGAMMNPHKVLMPQKAMYNMQAAQGFPVSDMSNMFPTDQMFPSWYREANNIPLLKAGSGGILGALGGLARQGIDKKTGLPVEGAYASVNPLQNPLEQFTAQYGPTGSSSPLGLPGAIGGPLGGIAQGVTPALKVPAEVLTGQSLGTGIPITDPNQYIGQQIPGFSNFQSMTNIGPLGPTKKGSKEGLGNPESLINFLSGANLRGSGPYEGQAQKEYSAANPSAKTVKTKANNQLRKQLTPQVAQQLKDSGIDPKTHLDELRKAVKQAMKAQKAQGGK